MDIKNNQCLLAYAKMIKDKYENGELITYLLPKIDHYLTRPWGQFRGFVAWDLFQGKNIMWDMDGENYYRLIVEDSELNLDSFKLLDTCSVTPLNLSFFDSDTIPGIDYIPDFEILNYILDSVENFYLYITENDRKDTDLSFFKFIMAILEKMDDNVKWYHYFNRHTMKIRECENYIEFSQNEYYTVRIPTKKH